MPKLKATKPLNPEKDRRMVKGLGSARHELRQGRTDSLHKTKRGSK